MSDAVVMAVGYVGLALIGVFLLWFVGEFVWAAIVTLSWLRWQFTMAHHNGGTLKTIKWKMLPRAVWRQYVDFLGYRDGSWACSGNAGYWSGVGQWNAWPVATEQHDNPDQTETT